MIRPIVRRMQTDLTQNKLNYEISSNFAVRMSRADYNGCLSTINDNRLKTVVCINAYKADSMRKRLEF